MSNEPATLSRDLPRPLTTLVGREREVAEVCDLLSHPDIRLLTLTGPGGVGKTRLALAIGETQRTTFQDGVVFASLREIANPDLVEAVVAEALSVGDVSGRSLRDGIGSTIGSRVILLILDNFEHVLESASLVSDLLQTCAGLHVVVTSRTPLHLYGEHEYAVQPLPLVAADRELAELAECPSIQLFVDRARMVNDRIRLTDSNAGAITGICARLDGLPLAIELAAARSRLLPPDELLARLEPRLPVLVGGPRDAPMQQRTLRDAIDWSFRLLSGDQQRLLAQLSVFADGWTLESARAVCDQDLDILEGLEALIDHSLVYQDQQSSGPSRFGMLETLREYAREKLDEDSDGAESVRRRFLDHFVTRIDPFGYRSGNIPDNDALSAWISDTRRELANLREALASAQSRDPRAMMDLVACLGWYWSNFDQWSEGRRWLELALSTASEPSLARFHALCHLSWIMSFQGYAREAVPIAEECLAIVRLLNVQQFIPTGVTAVARAWDFAGGYDLAVPLYEEAASLAREYGVGAALPSILGNLAGIAEIRGDFERAEQLLREAYERGLRLGWTDMATIWLNSLGRLAVLREHVEEARLLLTQSLDTSLRFEVKMRVVDDLDGFAGVAVLERRPEVAAELLGFCDAERERLGYPINVAEGGFESHVVDAARELLGNDRYAVAFATGRGRSMDEAVNLALTGEEKPAPVHGQRSTLSPREIDVVRLLVAGMTNQEIAAKLFISQHTVANHVVSILNKLGLESRTAVATWAVREGIV